MLVSGVGLEGSERVGCGESDRLGGMDEADLVSRRGEGTRGGKVEFRESRLGGEEMNKSRSSAGCAVVDKAT